MGKWRSCYTRYDSYGKESVIEGLVAYTLNLSSSSGLFNKATNYFSDIWNGPLARFLVSDSYTVGLSSNITAFLGVGTTPINFTLLTRGKEPGIYFTPTAVGLGIEANAGIAFGRGIFTGDPRQIQSSFLQGHSLGGSVGLGVGIDGSVGTAYAPADIQNRSLGGFINVGAQIGVGIQGSPATVINPQINYQYTPLVKPIFKF